MPQGRIVFRLVLLAVIGALAVGLALNFNRVVSGITMLFGTSVDLSAGGVTDAKAPEGFSVNVYASGLQAPRFMTVGPDGTVFVAEQSGGRVSALPDKDGDGKSDSRITVAEGLMGPSSLVFDGDMLLVGEHNKVSELVLGDGYRASSQETLIPNLPDSGGHRTKTVLVGEDGRIYVSMGSTCNVCNEADERRAAVSVYNRDGSDGETFARGLRNAVGLDLNPWTGEIWATNNGRDLLGDTEPPETVYVVKEGADYGWPRCHAGDLVDPDMGGEKKCEGVEFPVAELPAHTAPLGMTFYREGSFPAPYNNSLYIAMHGSWNSSVKVGYKVVRVPLENGKVAGEAEDFLTGFLRADGRVPGRPAGVTVARDGSLLVSDDKSGYIYRVAWKGR